MKIVETLSASPNNVSKWARITMKSNAAIPRNSPVRAIRTSLFSWASRLFLCFSFIFAIIQSPAFAETRFALVVDNSKYERTTPLMNPGNDATVISRQLSSLGFRVTRASDVTAQKFAEVLEAFMASANASKTGPEQNVVLLFYYAGHGMQYERQNYLVGVDAALESATKLRFETFRLDDVVDVLERNSDGSVPPKCRGMVRLSAEAESGPWMTRNFKRLALSCRA